MSSDLYWVSVESVADRTLRGRVYLAGGDRGYIPQESVFPLVLLAEAWWLLRKGYLYDDDYYGRYPLTEEQGRNIATTMRLSGEFADLAEPVVTGGAGSEDFLRRTDEIVTGYHVGPYHNVPLLAEIIAANPDQSPDSKELYVLGGPYDDLWEFQPDSEDEDRYTAARITENPCAEIKVTVSDAGYLEHMIAGMCWGTTMSEVSVE